MTVTTCTTAWLDFPELIEASRGRKIIFWGASNVLEKTLAQHDFDVAFVVDSARDKQGEGAFAGFDVRDPSCLDGMATQASHYVVIVSTAFYDIMEALERLGFRQGADFCAAPLLSNFKVIEDILACSTRLLVSCSDAVKDTDASGGGLYELACTTAETRKLCSGIIRGIARSSSAWYVVDAQKGVRVLDSGFQERDSYALPAGSAAHGIALDEEHDRIYVVLSTHDRIAVYQASTMTEEGEITLTDKYARSGGKAYHHHMNDVCLADSSLFVSMFSRTGTISAGWLNGAIVEYDLVEGRVLGEIAGNLWQPHSIRMLDGHLCYLDSMRGELHLAAHMAETHFNGFIRGLDFDGKYYFIGQSVHRYFDRMKGFSNNISVDCGVFIYDPGSKATHFVPVPTIRDINTIHVL